MCQGSGGMFIFLCLISSLATAKITTNDKVIQAYKWLKILIYSLQVDTYNFFELRIP